MPLGDAGARVALYICKPSTEMEKNPIVSSRDLVAARARRCLSQSDCEIFVDFKRDDSFQCSMTAIGSDCPMIHTSITKRTRKPLLKSKSMTFVFDRKSFVVRRPVVGEKDVARGSVVGKRSNAPRWRC